ncbi:hypothetical protein DOY81_012488 [Sarcophaga bullata]|nr:hypothetical protein DOY81_012488 [Sarcophaga bullata]
MFVVKLIVLMCLTVPCIWSMPSEQLEAEPDKTTKISWGPVWDDLEGNNEFVPGVQHDVPSQAGKNCSAPNGLGLQNLFRQIDNILPKQQIRNIMRTYDEDSQVKALKAYLQRPLTQQKLNAYRNSSAFRSLQAYVCRVLHINLLQYQTLVRILINPVVTRSGAEKRTGISGLLRAVNAVLPHQQIRALHRDLLASDPELVKAMNNLRSDEFRRLVLNARNVPAYQN